MSELKPCPFCGAMPKVNDWTIYGITDKRCFCDNKTCPVYLTKTIAIDDWNTRPIEDDLRTRIAELEALVERLIELGDVINGDKDSVWTLQTIKECWTEDVTKWKERE